MILYIIRHGDPVYNPDILTELGKRQAEALAGRLAVNGLDKVYASPLGRAVETAMPTCRLLNLECNIEDWMQEVWDDFAVTLDNGNKEFCFNLQNTLYLSEKNIDLNHKWYEADCLRTIDGKKAFEKIVRNSDKFLERHGYKRNKGIYEIERASNERIAAFCHAGFGIIWLAHLLNIPPHLVLSAFALTHTGITILEFRNNENGITAPRCLCLSDISHIYRENLPLKWCNEIDL